MRLSLFGILVPVVGCGCGSPLVVSDRNDFGQHAESVRQYVAGAVVTLHLDSLSPFVEPDRLEATSSDEDVFTVSDGDGDEVVLQTLAAGEAEIVFKQDGDVVDSRRIVVKEPARVELRVEVKAEGASDLVPPGFRVDPPLRVIVGREASLVVHVFDDKDEELFGASVAGIDTNDGGWASALVGDGPHSVIRLSPTPNAAPSTTMRLSVGGTRLPVDVVVEPVPEAELERIVLDEVGDERGREPGIHSTVLARGEDRTGRTLLGAPGWQLEGEDKGIGDAVTYLVSHPLLGPRSELVARIGSVEARRQIQADPRAVGVRRVEPTGCSAGASAMPLVLLALLGHRRRAAQPAARLLAQAP